MTEPSDNVVPFTLVKPKHLPELAVQLDETGMVTTVINKSRVEGDETAYHTTITPVFDGRFFCSMKDEHDKQVLWIVERFGIIRPGTPIECQMWFKNKTMAPDPSVEELANVSQTLLGAMRSGVSDTQILVTLLGYAAELCMRMAARASGQRLPTFGEAPSAPEQEPA
jgi:hypothetical protein